MPRFTRQTRLVEVGEIGQAKIAAAEARVRPAGLAGEIEARYLEAAGVGAVRRAPDAPAPSCPISFDDEGARAVGEGAWRALAQLRRVLEVGA